VFRVFLQILDHLHNHLDLGYFNKNLSIQHIIKKKVFVFDRGSFECFYWFLSFLTHCETALCKCALFSRLVLDKKAVKEKKPFWRKREGEKTFVPICGPIRNPVARSDHPSLGGIRGGPFGKNLPPCRRNVQQ